METKYQNNIIANDEDIWKINLDTLSSEKIDSEVKRIVDSAYDRTKKLLLDKREQLEKIANKLLEKEILFQNDLERLIGKRPFDAKKEVFSTNTLAILNARPAEIRTAVFSVGLYFIFILGR